MRRSGGTQRSSASFPNPEAALLLIGAVLVGAARRVNGVAALLQPGAAEIRLNPRFPFGPARKAPPA